MCVAVNSILRPPATVLYEDALPEPGYLDQPEYEEDLLEGIRNLFIEVDMVGDRAQCSRSSIHWIGLNAKLNNWKVTPIVIRRRTG